MTNFTKNYTELARFQTFKERLEYLRLSGGVGRATFGFDRYINQSFYRSPEWRRVRDEVILRDEGCDLGIPGHEIYADLLIHHMNPVLPDDIIHGERWILDPEYLITTNLRTHNAIHYGAEDPHPEVVIQRVPQDTKLW